MTKLATAKRATPAKRTARRKAPAGETHPGAAGVAATHADANLDPAVRIRFYCQGIGDCHLLRFRKSDGSHSWMLIDCGIHPSVSGGVDTIGAIVDDILSQTKRLDVIVLTHEHWDHNSGFATAQDKFKQFDHIGEIWLAWTENPADPQAHELDKFKGEALKALQGASQRLDRDQGQLTDHLAVVQQGLHAVLGFNFGAQGERVRAARNAARALAPDRLKYLEPKAPPFQLADVPNIRIYVLGPPRDVAALRLTERSGEMYGLSPGSTSVATALNNAFGASAGGI
jgi:hypothetical protein